MAGYDELKIKVGFELDKGVGTDLERQLAALSKAKDFKIEAKINIKDSEINKIEKLEKALERFNSMGNADINKISQIGRAFSSIHIDDSVVENINKVQKSLESFAKLNTDLQKRLANVSMFGETEKDIKGVTMQMEQFDNQVQETVKKLQGGLKGSSESLTGYVNAQTGTVKTLVEQLNDVYKVTKNIDANGNVIGKVTGNVDGYVNKVGSMMQQNYNKLLKYQGDYYKAVANQDKDMMVGLESLMDYHSNKQKILTQELDDNGLKDYAKDTVKEIKELYDMQSKITDLKGINLLDKEQLKDDEKALSTFIKQYKDVITDLKKYEPQLLSAESKGNTSDADFLRDKVTALRSNKEALEEMIPSFKNWEKALKDFEKQDSELQDRIKQKMAQLKDADNKKITKDKAKEEDSEYKNTLSKYKELSSEIKKLTKDQLDAFKNGDTLTFDNLEKDIQVLSEKRNAIRETIKDLKDYEKAQKEVNEIDKEVNDDINRKVSKIQDSTNKAQASELERMKKENEKLEKNRLYKDLADYRKNSSDLVSATNEYYKAVENGSNNTAKLYEKEMDALSKKKEEYLKAIAANKHYNEAEDDLKDIETESARQLAKQKAMMQDLRDKSTQKELSDIEKMYAKLFDQQGIADIEKRNNEPQKRKEELDKYVKDYESKVNEIVSLSAKMTTAMKGENVETVGQYKKEISGLEEQRASLEKLIKTHENYVDVKKKMAEADKKIEDSSLRNQANLKDDTNKKDTDAYNRDQKNKYNYLLNDYKETVNKINELAKKQREALDTGNKPLFNQITDDIKALKKKESALKDDMSILKDYAKISEEVAKINKKNRDELNRTDAKRQGNNELKQKAEVEKLTQSYEKLGKAIQENLSKADKLKDSSFLKDTNIKDVYNDLQKLSNINFGNMGQADIDNLNTKVEKLAKTLREFENIKVSNKQLDMNNLKIDKLESEFKSLENQIRKTLGDSQANALIADLNQLRQAASKSGDEFDVMARRYTNSMDEARRSMRNLNTDLSHSSGFFNDFYDNLFTFTAGELLADGIQNVGYALKDLVMEYDSAMTNLKKVANPADIMNQGQLEAIEQKAVQIAKNVGGASQDVIQAISDTIQMSGRSMEESMIIAEQTMMLANVAEMTQESASQAVVSMMAAFNLDPLKEVPVLVDGVTKSTTELTNAMDMVNYVGNNFSISSEGIVNALQKGGSVLAQYGVSMTDTIALVSGANKVLQDPEVVGNGLKSIAINLSGITTSARDGSIQLNKTAKTLKEVGGIDVFKDKQQTQVKDMAQIMEEVNQIWDSLTQKDQLALANAIAGKQQAKVFQALMAGWKDVKAIQQELGNGDHFGSAFAENEQYIDSISGKLNKLKETWVGIFQTVFNDASIKGMLDGLISVSEVIADIVSALDSLNLAGPTALMGLFGGFKLLKGLAGRGSNGFLGNMVDSMFGLQRATDEVGNSVTRTSRSTGLLGRAWDLVFGARSVNSTRQAAEGVETVARASKLSVAGLKEMGKGFVANMSVGMKFGLVATAIAGVVTAIDYLNGALDRQEAKIGESVKNQETEINQLEQKRNSLQSIQEEYDTLYNNSNRTTEETARLLELNKQIAEIMPDLVSGYDAEGNPILDMKGDISSLITEMERGIDTKKRLLSSERNEQADVAAKKLNGQYSTGKGADAEKSKTEVGKLTTIQQKYADDLVKIQEKKNKALDKLQAEDIKTRREGYAEYQKLQNDEIKLREQANNQYLDQVATVREYSSQIAESMFDGFEVRSDFKDMIPEIDRLKQSLDFSDLSFKELGDAEANISLLMNAAKNGKVDLGSLNNQLEAINTQFKESGDLDEYNRSMSQMAEAMAQAVQGTDAEFWNKLFTQINEGAIESANGLDVFLKAHNKTINDLNSGDSVAKSIENQYNTISSALDEVNSLTGTEEIDKEILVNLYTNQDLPSEFADMLRTLSNQGHSSTDVLKFAQEVLIDLQDGEVDIEALQKRLDALFGEGSFEITPDILINSEVKTAQVDQALESVKNRFGEIPVEVETLVKANSLTAEADINRVMAMYELCPDEVKTLIETEGNEQAYQTITTLMEQYNRVPLELKTSLQNNGVESVSQIVELNNIYNSLPTEVQTYIKANNFEALTNAKTVEEVLANIPPEKLIDILTNTEGKEDIEAIKQIIDKLPPEVKTKVQAEGLGAIESIGSVKENLDTMPKEVSTKVKAEGEEAKNTVSSVKENLDTMPKEVSTKVTADLSDAESKMSLWESIFGRKKTQELKVKATADTSGAESKISSLENKKIKSKDVKIKANSKEADSKIGGIEKKKIKDKDVKIKANSKDADNKISKVDGKKLKDKTTNLKGVDKASSIINTINNKSLKDKSATYTITTKYKTIGSPAPTPSGASLSNVSEEGVQVRGVGISAQKVQAHTLAIQDSVQQGLGAIDNFNSSANMVVRTPTVEDMPSLYNFSNPLDTVKYSLNYFIELENSLKKISAQLSIIDEKAKRAIGQEKIDYLKKQNELYKQQQELQKLLMTDMNKYQASLKNFLSGKGFSFNADGNIDNYHTKLVAMEKELERLEEEAKKASEASSNYKGDNEKEKDRLSNNVKDTQEKVTKYRESLDEIKKAMSEYINVTFDDIPKAQEEWEKLNGKIEDNLDLIEEIARGEKLFEHQNKVKELGYEYDKLSDRLSIIDIKMKHVYGKDKIDLMNEQIALMEKQKKIQEELIESYKKQIDVYKQDLSGYGFKFDSNGDVLNLDETLNKFKGHKDLEKIQKLVEDYIKLQRDELPDATKEWEKLESEIKDIYKEQLKITKEMEDEITQIYKKQVEERKKLIDQELNAKLKALEKEKNAYKEMREEADYQDSYDNQLNKIQELQKEYDKLSGDNSLGSKKKLEELLKEIEEEQKKLEDLVQNKIDKDIEDMFDKESERLEEEAEKEKEQLDKDFSDEKIQELVKQALSTGVFQEIDGTMRSLQDVMLDFVDEYGDGMSVIGDLIKNEMIANLEAAKKTMKELSNIYKELDLSKYTTSSSRMVGQAGSSMVGRSIDYGQKFEFNSPMINIEGNVDRGVIDSLESLENRLVDKICKEIVAKTNGR